MFAENRRLERKAGVLNVVTKNFAINKQIDLTGFEEEGKYLEGTGSMVLDRDKRIAYACLSPRTDLELLEKFCAEMNYRSVVFHSVDRNGQPVYHTNVMMCVADKYVVICMDTIKDPAERRLVEKSIDHSGKEIISITIDQMNHFAGNMLQVANTKGKKFLVMSSQAYHSLTAKQLEKLENYNPVLHSPLNTIESNGGGSARCMMAEIDLPLR